MCTYRCVYFQNIIVPRLKVVNQPFAAYIIQLLQAFAHTAISASVLGHSRLGATTTETRAIGFIPPVQTSSHLRDQTIVQRLPVVFWKVEL
jgi:hypothetical protein